ncbi:MAG TPA: hypothetical protein VN814_09055 [Caulobacteraceae bacterium]|nr:hypothetical protein [Caulobacteraceae bacterium]
MKRAQDQSKRAALRALERARRAAAATGADLSAWEGEFLGSVEDRVRTYGRAFADPAKGEPGESLSAQQHVKLKEITRKARGADRAPRKPLRAKRGLRRGPNEKGRA